MHKNTKTSRDFFLKGSLEIIQPIKGYRAGIDAVLLAAAAQKCNAPQICELGAGVGTALLSLLKRKNDNALNALALEIDTQTYSYLNENICQNGFENMVQTKNIDGLIPKLEIENKFDLVVSNPPFFDDNSKIRDPDESRQKAYIIGAPLLKWIKSMLRLCHSKGDILIIHRADRVYDIIHALQNRAGDIRILPIHPKTGENANRVLVRAKKSSKAPMQILPALYMRDSENSENYFKEIDEMCNGAALPIFNGLWE